MLHQGKNRKTEHGQIFVILALIIPLLLIFTAFSVDFGMAYITKTTLAKAVDAAALAAMKNLSAGQTTAAKDATAVFNANYQSIPGLGTPVVPTMANDGISWGADSYGNTTVTVSATATINTYFLGVMDLVTGGTAYKTLTVGASASAIRNPLVMSLVLDRSGSMNNNNGADALPQAVKDFVADFDEGVDNVAEISFSSVDSVDVPMTTSFQTLIDNEFPSHGQPFGGQGFAGGTFAQAGLQDGFVQILSKPIQPNIIRVAVFFTDGWANVDGLPNPATITTATASSPHDILNCTGGNPPTTRNPASNTTIDYGGCAPLENAAGWCGTSGDNTMYYLDPTTGNTASCPNGTGTPPNLTFNALAPSLSGPATRLTQNNVSIDATWRTEQLAQTMRNSTNEITIYTIGLGDKINAAYLQNLANVNGVADSGEPEGDYEYAACENTQKCQTELDSVFGIIAAKILLRLTK